MALNNADAAILAAADPTAGGSGEEYQAGYEFAGDVTAVGDGVDTTTVGRRVMGTSPASFAHYVLADHRHTLPAPPELARAPRCRSCSAHRAGELRKRPHRSHPLTTAADDCAPC
ncbi:alcohol dehydrogenase catalytic domain-containing protein [Streptomyces sp. RKAG290]|uniref:alcohol dehydrogenase catalytic domain-containing protein n=1 Tax=Streptomyces sp. RKAG290 TaxID=2888348 RepID=UPI0020335D84|nr:hypothetical protein [Streptomyces sp. RKAG290]MCM2416237.1 hypothetical protein [Streptomyces sp. RKAG290]